MTYHPISGCRNGPPEGDELWGEAWTKEQQRELRGDGIQRSVSKRIRTPEQIEADFEAMKNPGMVNEDFGGRRE